jgi:hypothetical protein
MAKENPTPKGRASCVLFGNGTLEAFTISAHRTQRFAACYALPFEAAAIIAALAVARCGHG